MKISYIKAMFVLDFESSIKWRALPTFFLRSILGAQLKRICCVQRQSTCDECSLSASCAYSVLFESPLDTANEVLQGRNRGYHPFILTHGAFLNDGFGYHFTVTLVGKGIHYFPFIVFAFQQAGSEGVFSSKIKYRISELTDQATGKSLQGINLKTPQTQIFSADQAKMDSFESVSVEFITPARIKHLGKYTLDFDAISFFSSIYRRTTALSRLYEESSSDEISTDEKFIVPEKIHIAERNLKWKDFSRYSQRQQTEMELGGIVGRFMIAGGLRASDISLLEAGRLFHVGKNTVFGLGQMDFNYLNN
jgi:hypothetical protein